MSIFQKLSKESESSDRFPEYVDALVSEEDAIPSFIHERIVYGIDETIQLMRRLPVEKQDWVISVVRETLASTNIDVSAIILDASQKAATLENKISTLSEEIEGLELSIKNKKVEISDTNTDLEETHKVKELLEASQPASDESQAKAKTIEPSIETLNPEDEFSGLNAIGIGSGG